MEGLELTDPLRECYAGRRVLVTGHTGFKGAWLTAWLQMLECEVFGYALPAPTGPRAVYDVATRVAAERLADVRDAGVLSQSIRDWRPAIIFHLAAQPLVRASYEDPVGTFSTNVLGVVHVLEAARHVPDVKAVVVVTTDKCYDNREWCWPYRETDALGGADPYSASKACAEIATAAYRRSFLATRGCAVASARAGNVIGGGDWSLDRLVPDLARSLAAGQPARLRNPGSVRPFQHVLEAVGAYLLLGQRLLLQPALADCYNFGPRPGTELTVAELARRFTAAWGEGAVIDAPEAGAPHEAGTLRLDSSKSAQSLGWTPLLTNDEMIEQTVEWYRASAQDKIDLAALTLGQIGAFHRRAAASYL